MWILVLLGILLILWIIFSLYAPYKPHSIHAPTLSTPISQRMLPGTNPSILWDDEGWYTTSRMIQPKDKKGLTSTLSVQHPQGSMRFHDLIGEECECSGVEDARLFSYRGDKWVIFNACIADDDCKNHMFIMPLSTRQRRELLYSNKIEKNWTVFVQGDRLLVEYTLQPHTILQINPDTGVCTKVAETSWVSMAGWELHGGNNPILVDGLYIGLAHAKNRGKYYHFVYTFESVHPYRILHVSHPLRIQDKYDIEFGIGMEKVGDRVYISYGVGDKEAWMVSYPWEYLCGMAQTLPVGYLAPDYDLVDVYIITLKEFPERYRRSKTRLREAGHTKIIKHYGVYGKKEPEKMKDATKRWNLRSDVGEFAIGSQAASVAHLDVLATFLQSQQGIAMIVEDDILLPRGWMAMLNRVLCLIPDDADIIYPGWQRTEVNTPDKPIFPHYPFCSHCYIVTRKGAEKITQSIRTEGLPYTFDIWFVERAKKNGVVSYVVNPKYFMPGKLEDYGVHTAWKGRSDGIAFQDEEVDSVVSPLK